MISKDLVKKVVLTQAQYKARESAGTLEYGVEYEISDYQALSGDSAGENITITQGLSGGHDIPSEYIELSYLESDGTAYINLGSTYTKTTSQTVSVEIDGQFLDTAPSAYVGLGCWSDTTNQCFIAQKSGSGGIVYYGCHAANSTLYTQSTSTAFTRTVYKILNNGSYSYVYENGTQKYSVTNTSTTDFSFTNHVMYLFSLSNQGGGTGHSRIYEVNITCGSTNLTLVAAKRKSDGVLGMYDVINDTFYTNAASSGSFMGGTPYSDELFINALSGLTASVSELNILDGATVTTSELNKLDGVTSTTSELNKLHGVTSTTSELNKLHGVTATAAQLNYLNTATSNIQTQLNAKSAVQVSGTFSSTVNFTLSGTTLAITTS